MDADDKPCKETEDRRRHRQRTNASIRDQDHTEGDVALVERVGDELLVTIALGRGETPVIVARCPRGQCIDIRVGDYIEVDGEQGDDGRLYAEHIDRTQRS